MNKSAVIARLATQDEAIQRSSCRMDCFALPAMTEDDEQICGHCEACNARRSNPARFLQNEWLRDARDDSARRTSRPSVRGLQRKTKQSSAVLAEWIASLCSQ